MDPKKINFIHSSITNTTGNYTVLRNAEALANETLKPNVLKISVWKNVGGQVWTLDHRRLGAFRVQWVVPNGEIWKCQQKMEVLL